MNWGNIWIFIKKKTILKIVLISHLKRNWLQSSNELFAPNATVLAKSGVKIWRARARNALCNSRISNGPDCRAVIRVITDQCTEQNRLCCEAFRVRRGSHSQMANRNQELCHRQFGWQSVAPASSGNWLDSQLSEWQCFGFSRPRIVLPNDYPVTGNVVIITEKFKNN